MKNKERNYTYIFYTYICLMLLSFSGYKLLLIYRFNKSGYWQSIDYLREEHVERIAQLGDWNTTFELTFIILFLLMGSFSLIKSRKDNNKNILKQFLIINTILFIGIIGLIYVLSLVISFPIGNLLSTIITLVIILIGLFIYYIIANFILLKLRGN